MRVAGGALHEGVFWPLVREGDGGHEVGAEVDDEDHDDLEAKRDLGGDVEEEGDDLGDI